MLTVWLAAGGDRLTTLYTAIVVLVREVRASGGAKRKAEREREEAVKKKTAGESSKKNLISM